VPRRSTWRDALAAASTIHCSARPLSTEAGLQQLPDLYLPLTTMPSINPTPLKSRLAATDVSFQIPSDTASLTYLLDNDDDFLRDVDDSLISRTPTLSRANRMFEASQATSHVTTSTVIPSSSTIPATQSHVGVRRSPRKAISKSSVLNLKNEHPSRRPSPSGASVTLITSSLSSSTPTSLPPVQHPASPLPPVTQTAPNFSQLSARLHEVFRKEGRDDYARGDQVLPTSPKGKGLVKENKKRVCTMPRLNRSVTSNKTVLNSSQFCNNSALRFC
jgi:hypothetical protein